MLLGNSNTEIVWSHIGSLISIGIFFLLVGKTDFQWLFEFRTW